ncbi:thioesterase [Bounagaea algeriensis]
MAMRVELADLRRLVGQLRSTAHALRARYGEHPQLIAVDEDVERLQIDIAELGVLLGQLPQQPPAGGQPRSGAEGSAGASRTGGGRQEGTVFVPEAEHDPSLWGHVDDEGLGGQLHGG